MGGIIRLRYSEGRVRPIGAAWISDSRILVVRNTGVVEWFEDSEGSDPQYVTSLARPALVVAGLGGVSVLHERRVTQFSGAGHSVTIRSSEIPIDAGDVATFAPPGIGQATLVTKKGAVWCLTSDATWQLKAERTLADATCACVLSANRFAIGSRSGELQLLDTNVTADSRAVRVHADAVQAITPLDSGLVASVSRDRALRVWDTNTGLSLAWSIPDLHEHFVNVATVIDEELWTGASDGTLVRTSIGNRVRVDSARPHSDAIRSIQVSPGGEKVLIVCDDGTLSVLDRDGTILRRHGTPRQYIRCADVEDTAMELALGTTAGGIRTGPLNAEELPLIEVSDDPIRAVSFFQDHSLLAGDDGGRLWLVQRATFTSAVLDQFSAGITAICVLGGGQVAVGARDGMVRLFQIASSSVPNAELVCERRVHDSIVGDIVEDERWSLLTSSDDHAIRSISRDTLASLKTWTLDNTAINNLLRHEKGLIATTDGGRVFVLEGPDLSIARVFDGHSEPVRAAAMAFDGHVATGDRSGKVIVWNPGDMDVQFSCDFQDRVIRLNSGVSGESLLVVTESEVGEVFLDTTDDGGPTLASAPVTFEHVTEAPEFDIDAMAVPDIELVRSDRSLVLDRVDDGLIREFVRSRNGTRGEVSRIGGGLSSARVFRVLVFDQDGGIRVRAIAKVGDNASIAVEASGYDGEVSRLGPDASPRRLDTFDMPRTDFSGVFYSLSQDYDRSLFDVAADSAEEAAQLIGKLSTITAPWREGVPERRVMCREIRRAALKDATLQELRTKYDLDWVEDFETFNIQSRMCTAHGDLHGENVLVNRSGGAMLIDYGDIKLTLSAYDPITLEFSLFFHTAGPLRGSDWPRPEQAKQWRTPNYLEGCPIPELVEACWNWQDSVAAGQREVAVAAYAYLVRQLKYPDTSKERVVSLLRGVRNHFAST